MKSKYGMWVSLGLLLSLVAVGSKAQAQNSGENPNLSFVETIGVNRAIPPKIVYNKIKSFALQKGTYLSLGESHLESETVNSVNHKLARLFTDRVKNKFSFCSETIEEFLSSSQGKDLIRRAKDTKIFKGNSADKTDFANCQWLPNSNALTYSGFFHQYRFARAWPKDFPPTPVTVEPGNNILEQLNPRKGLFISQIELIWLQTLASRNLILNASRDVKEFRSRAEALLKQVDLIKANMGLLDGKADQPLKNKYGIYLGKQSFNQTVPMDSNSWFLITNRGINKNSRQMGFIEKLLQKSDAELGRFLLRMTKDRPYYMGGYIGPNAKGERIQLQYGGLVVDGEADILQINNRLMFSDFESKDFECVRMAADEISQPTKISCESFF